MTLDELQIVITANIAQIMPQVMEARQAFASLGQAAGTAGTGIDKSMSDSSKATQTALDKSNTAEKQSAQETQKATATKRQSLEEIAAIAEKAAQRYQESVSGMTGDGGPLEPPVALRGGSGLATGSKPAAAATNTQPQLTALQRLQAAALRVRQSIAGMFSSAQQGAQGASAAMQELTSKLDNINARADIQRQKLTSFQAEYDRVAAGAGGAGSDEAMALQEKILTTEARLQSLSAQSDKTAAAIRNLDAGLTETGSAATRAAEGATKAGSSFRSASSGASGFERGLQRIQMQIFRNLVVYGLLIKGIQSIGTYMWEALKTNTAFSDSLNNLKVQLLTAFQPIYQAILPALTSFINAMARAMSYVAAFVAGFFGTTYAKAEQSAAALNKNVKALQDTASAAKKLNDTTLGFDELNIVKPDTAADKPTTGADAALANTNFGAASAKPLISDAQIKSAEAAGERIRKIFDKIYGFVKKYEVPIKAAIVGIVSAFLLFKTVQFVSGIISGIAAAFAFLAANPIVAIVIAIGALTAAFIYLWNTNSNFRSGVILIWTAIQDFYINAWDAIKGAFIDAWNAIVSVWDGCGDFFNALGTKIVVILASTATWIAGGFLDAWSAIEKVWKNVGAWFGQRRNDIQNAFKDVKTWIGQKFSDAWSAVQMAFKDAKSFFDGVWANIQGAFTTGKNDVVTWFSTVFGTAYSDMIGAFKTVSADFGSIWSKITGAFSKGGISVKSWFGQTFGSAYAAVTGAFSNIGTFFSQVWSGLQEGFRGFVNFIIGGMNTVISAVLTPINALISGWNGTVGKIAGKIPQITIQIPTIPKLAAGGLAYSATLAMVGDNPGASANPEVIAPLDKLKSIMGSDNSDVVNTLKTLIGVVQSKEFSAALNLDGRTVAKAVNKASRGMGAPILGGAFAH